MNFKEILKKYKLEGRGEPQIAIEIFFLAAILYETNEKEGEAACSLILPRYRLIEDRNHFEALVPRIYELGGELPECMKAFHDLSACPPASLPKDPTDVKAMLEVLVKAERCAVMGYTHICNMTAGKDHRTYDLALAILNEEIEHESWFSEFLGEGPSGHFMRRGDTSPFVSKFLK